MSRREKLLLTSLVIGAACCHRPRAASMSTIYPVAPSPSGPAPAASPPPAPATCSAPGPDCAPPRARARSRRSIDALPAAPVLTGEAIEIDAGSHHVCALLADRSVSCWGRNGSGQLGGSAPDSTGNDW